MTSDVQDVLVPTTPKDVAFLVGEGLAAGARQIETRKTPSIPLQALLFQQDLQTNHTRIALHRTLEDRPFSHQVRQI